MRLSLHLAQRRLLMLASAMLACALSACAGPQLVTLPAFGCGKLVPQRYRQPVEAPPLPGDGTVGGWIAFGDAAVGKLDLANDHGMTALEIVDGCEAQQRAAKAALKPRPWWKFWG